MDAVIEVSPSSTVSAPYFTTHFQQAYILATILLDVFFGNFQGTEPVVGDGIIMMHDCAMLSSRSSKTVSQTTLLFLDSHVLAFHPPSQPACGSDLSIGLNCSLRLEYGRI